MKRTSQICCTLTLLLMSLGAVPPANAVGLLGFSPDPATLNGAPLGFNIPAWFQDQNGVALQPCLDVEPCGLAARDPDPITGDPGFNPLNALSFPNNFPEESFYFNVDTGDFPVGPFTANFGIALEIVFNDAITGNPTFPSAPGAVATPFQRLRFTYTYVGLAGAGFLPPGADLGNYTISTPWGDLTLAATDPEMFRTGIGCGTAFQTHDTKCVLTRDLFSLPNALPPDFAPALGNGTVPFGNAMSTFLQDPAAPLGFLSNGLVPALTFTGAPVGRLNRFTVTDSLGNTGSTTQLRVLFGKKFGMEVAPTVFDFGALPETTTSPAKTVIVTNINTSDLTLGPLTLTGPNLADFTLVAGTCSAGATLPPASTCTFTVAFAPKALAPEVALRTAMVNIPGTSAGAAAPTGRITLSGTAQLPLTVAVATSITDPVNTGTGTLTSIPAGINCSSAPASTCTAPFAVGTVVTLVPAGAAIPVSVLDGWTGACTGAGACTVTMDAAKGAAGSPAVTANFVTVHNITTSATPAAGGTITPTLTVKHGSTPTVVITPTNTLTPRVSYRLGSLTDNAGPAAFTPVVGTISSSYQLLPVDKDHTVTANFIRTFNVASTVAGNGSVDKPGTLVIDDGTTPSYTLTPSSKKFQVGKILVNDAPLTFTKPATISGVVSVALPPVTTDETVNAIFVPSGDLDESGTVDVADALKALKIFVNLRTPDSTDKAAMKIGPLDAAGVPTGGAGDPDLNDIILILKKAVGIVKW